jgi:hypothetical protein
MSISDLYATGLHQQNIGHFATIVRMALLDNKIDQKELGLLKRLAIRLDITNLEYKSILKDPTKYPVNPPVNHEDRMARLFDLTKMIFLDRHPGIDKTTIMTRIAVGLGFPIENVQIIVKEAIDFFLKEPDLENFKKVIGKVNKIEH